MRDVLFLVIVVGFFALATAYVRGCAAVVAQGVSDPSQLTDAGRDDDSEAPA